MKDRRFITKGELIALLIMLILSLAVAVLVNSKENGDIAEITYKQKVYYISLNTDRNFSLSDITGDESAPDMTFVIENGRIKTEFSDCPGQDCVRTGWAFRDLDVISCIPNRVSVVVRAEEANEFDVII
jgi:hypothetical protein